MKLAYPNFDEYIPSKPVYDIGKWMGAMRDVYAKVHFGNNKEKSIGEVIADWGDIEKKDFKKWLSYYESGDHLKYKMAQHNYYVNDDMAGYFIPNPPQRNIPSPIRNVQEEITNIPQDMAAQQAAQQAQQQAHKNEQLSREQKRKLIEDQRKKIIGRLNSAERLLSSHEGQMFAGQEFEKLLSAIYELKKQIQTINKLSLASSIYEDLIIRQANLLAKSGFVKSSYVLQKIAQGVPGNFNVNQGPTPAGGSKIDGTGTLQNQTPPIPGLVPGQPGAAPEAEEDPLKSFVDNLQTSGLTDLQEADDLNEVSIDDDVLLDQEIIPEDEEELTVEAQAAPVAPPAPSAPAPEIEAPVADVVEEPLEVESPSPDEPQPDGESAESGQSNFDNLIDSAFASVTVADVVKKLEEINQIFKRREISRQLAIVDAMLNHLGLSTYFPSLAEATHKSLESNQYCLTRVEDVISKLRGSLNTKEIDLMGGEDVASQDPNAAKAKQNLEIMDQKDKTRKEMRKKVQDSELDNKMKEPLEVENVPEDLAEQPAQVEAPAPAAAQPPAPRPVR